MPSVTDTTLTIDQLQHSRLNVRLNRDDATAVAALEASILERGLIHPISAHPQAGTKKRGAFAGGRRYRAIANLVGRGELPSDYPVRIKLYEGYSDAEIVELSWSENLLRRDLRRYEDCAAAARLVRLGKTPAQIAHDMGQAEKIITGWARIGDLAPEIFAAFEQGKETGGIDYEEAQAFAATADHALQSAVWEQLRDLPAHSRTPAKIRAALKVGDLQLLRRLRLVGEDAYREAGGTFELDLFAGDAELRGRVVDEGLLTKLAEAKLEQVRVATRAATRPDLRFVAQPPQTQWKSTDETLRAPVGRKQGGGIEVKDGVVAVIDVGESGEPQVTYWWETRAAKYGTTSGRAQAKAEKRELHAPIGGSAVSDPYTHAPVAKAQAREEHGVSADALYAVRCIRREIERALVVTEAERGGRVGLLYAVWAQLRALLVAETEDIGLRSPPSSDFEVGSTHAGMDLARARIEEQQAHSEWSAAVQRVRDQDFITEPDLDRAFRLFLHAGRPAHNLAGAVLTGILLQRSAVTPGYDFASHRELMAACGATPAAVRQVWSPTAEFLELFPKAQQLAIAEPLIDAGSHAKWHAAKRDELTLLLAQALNGAGHAVPGRHRQAAREWVHPLLSFDPPEDVGDDGDPGAANDADVLDVAEAAE